MNNTNNPTQQDLLTQKLSEDGILRLTLNDEKRRNALSEEMMAALSESLNQASTNDAVQSNHNCCKRSCILLWS